MPEAFLACSVKCHLLSEGEVPAGTEYSAWAAAREESYRREGVRKLTSQETGRSIAAAEPGLWKHESWRFAVGRTVIHLPSAPAGLRRVDLLLGQGDGGNCLECCPHVAPAVNGRLRSFRDCGRGFLRGKPGYPADLLGYCWM